MLTQFQDYLTFESIYLWTTIGVIPFWLMLIFIPSSRITQIFVNSIFLPLILGALASYVIYMVVLLDESLLDIFHLYFSLESLYTIFAVEGFLLSFWLHFLALSLFLGSWVSRDGIKYNIPRSILVFFIILIYFTGPVGLVFYWMIRVFYSKKLGFND